jgi:crotonobetainyl-CoA:carnitine CoA-transferase CaiB-like acyl-CoA transferase
MAESLTSFGFRPWVRRAGLSIVIVAAAVTAAIAIALAVIPSARYGWFGERFVWVYLGTLWLGGLKVWTGTLRPIAEAGETTITLRPLHQFRSRTVRWSDISGTEQMVGGDRLIVYFDTPRGMRFVALNLNLVKGRREFLKLLDERLLGLGFKEKVVERSRYLSRA